MSVIGSFCFRVTFFPQQTSVKVRRSTVQIVFAVRMPKRTYPFPEAYSSQYKMHIGQKEFNNYGVLGNKCRQEIYAKTKNLLFNGAQAVMGKTWTGEEQSTDTHPTGQIQTSACSQTLLRGQTLIGHDGRLTRASAAQGAPVSPTGCCVCQKSKGARSPCSQCDRLVCSTCRRQCSGCSSLCCSVCTVIDYSGQYDEVLCCSCST